MPDAIQMIAGSGPEKMGIINRHQVVATDGIDFSSFLTAVLPRAETLIPFSDEQVVDSVDTEIETLTGDPDFVLEPDQIVGALPDQDDNIEDAADRLDMPQNDTVHALNIYTQAKSTDDALVTRQVLIAATGHDVDAPAREEPSSVAKLPDLAKSGVLTAPAPDPKLENPVEKTTGKSAGEPAKESIPNQRISRAELRFVASTMAANPQPQKEGNSAPLVVQQPATAVPDNSKKQTEPAKGDERKLRKLDTERIERTAPASPPATTVQTVILAQENWSKLDSSKMPQLGATDDPALAAAAMDSARSDRMESGAVLRAQAIHPGAQPEHVRHVANQIAVAVSKSADGSTELSLNPAELGRVRLTLTTLDNSLVLSVLAERPETTEMMRRNIEQLGQEFRNLGYRDIQFSFGSGDARNSGRQGHRNDSGEHVVQTQADVAGLATSEVTKAVTAGLDLRL